MFVVLEHPAPLAGMPYPAEDFDWHALHARGFARVVRLHPAEYDPAPLEVDEVLLEDLYGGRVPSDPAREEERVRLAAQLAAAAVRRGEGVVVHCVGGTGRTGTVLACALRILGRSEADAVAAVQAKRPHWPESQWQADVVARCSS